MRCKIDCHNLYSKLRPTWTKWHKIKILREPRDKELVGKQSTLHGQSRDGLRDWYFLDPSEQAQLLTGGRQRRCTMISRRTTTA